MVTIQDITDEQVINVEKKRILKTLSFILITTIALKNPLKMVERSYKMPLPKIKKNPFQIN